MLRVLLALVLVAGLAGAATAAPADAPAATASADAKDASATKASTDAKDAPAAKDASDAKPKVEEKNPKWFSSANPFAPLKGPEAAKEGKPAPTEGAAPSPEAAKGQAAPSGTQPTAKTEPAAAVPKLNGILFSSRLTVAIIDDTLAKIGDQVAGLKVTGISSDTVTAEKDGTRYVMTIRCPLAQAQADPPAAKPAAADPPKAAPQGESESSRRPEKADNDYYDLDEQMAAEADPSGDGPRAPQEKPQ